MKSFLKTARLALAAAFSAALLAAAVPVFGQANDVVIGGGIQIDVRQGVCPIKIESDDSALGGFVQRALKMHGAIDMRGGGNVLTVRVGGRGGNLFAEGKAFPREILVEGDSDDAKLRLCDEILAAVGKLWGWELKPLFSKTKIAFAAGTGAKSEIYTSNLMFRGTRRVTSHGSRSIMPHWDPAGTRLLYTTYFKSGAADVYSVDLASGVATRFAAYRNTNTGGAAPLHRSRGGRKKEPHRHSRLFLRDGAGVEPRVPVENRFLLQSPRKNGGRRLRPEDGARLRRGRAHRRAPLLASRLVRGRTPPRRHGRSRKILRARACRRGKPRPREVHAHQPGQPSRRL